MGNPGRITLTWTGRRTDFQVRDDLVLPATSATDPAQLVLGDNLEALSALTRAAAGSASLVYLDPPFFTQRKHQQVVRARSLGGGVTREERLGFDDRWADLGAYLNELWPRLVLARQLLSREGCLILHVDPKTSHYAKILLDELFGPECFASEIVWRYRRWPSKTRNFQRVHDVLLRYVKDKSAVPRFHQLYEPLAPSTRATWGTGRQIAVVGAEGRRVRSKTTDQPSLGTPLGDVWEIGIVAPVARERTGYPTQKPEALLSRLIEACTEPGDLVVDPYAGSGTSLVAAIRLGRRAIGIDQNPEAIQLSEQRLRALECPLRVVRLKAPVPALLQNPAHAEPKRRRQLVA